MSGSPRPRGPIRLQEDAAPGRPVGERRSVGPLLPYSLRLSLRFVNQSAALPLRPPLAGVLDDLGPAGLERGEAAERGRAAHQGDRGQPGGQRGGLESLFQFVVQRKAVLVDEEGTGSLPSSCLRTGGAGSVGRRHRAPPSGMPKYRDSVARRSSTMAADSAAAATGNPRCFGSAVVGSATTE